MLNGSALSGGIMVQSCLKYHIHTRRTYFERKKRVQEAVLCSILSILLGERWVWNPGTLFPLYSINAQPYKKQLSFLRLHGLPLDVLYRPFQCIFSMPCQAVGLLAISMLALLFFMHKELPFSGVQILFCPGPFEPTVKFSRKLLNTVII